MTIKYAFSKYAFSLPLIVVPYSAVSLKRKPEPEEPKIVEKDAFVYIPYANKLGINNNSDDKTFAFSNFVPPPSYQLGKLYLIAANKIVKPATAKQRGVFFNPFQTKPAYWAGELIELKNPYEYNGTKYDEFKIKKTQLLDNTFVLPSSKDD